MPGNKNRICESVLGFVWLLGWWLGGITIDLRLRMNVSGSFMLVSFDVHLCLA